MENFFNIGIVDQAKTGVFRTMFRGDIATPMVATKDVGEKAAELLTLLQRKIFSALLKHASLSGCILSTICFLVGQVKP